MALRWKALNMINYTDCLFSWDPLKYFVIEDYINDYRENFKQLKGEIK